MEKQTIENSLNNPGEEEKLKKYEEEKIRLHDELEKASRENAGKKILESIIRDIAKLEADTLAEIDTKYWNERFDNKFEELEEVYLVEN